MRCLRNILRFLRLTDFVVTTVRGSRSLESQASIGAPCFFSIEKISQGSHLVHEARLCIFWQRCSDLINP